MHSFQSFKFIGGITGILSGILLFLAHVLNFFGDPGIGTTAGKLLVFSAHTLVVFIFMAIYLEQTGKNGVIGTLGMFLSIIGTIIVTAIVFVEIAQTSGEHIEHILTATGTQAIYSFGPLLFVVGIIFVGISVLKARILPKWGGLLLIIGTIAFALGSLLEEMAAYTSIVGSGFTAGGLIWLGYNMISSKTQSDKVHCDQI